MTEDRIENLTALLKDISGIQNVLDTADKIIGYPLCFLDIKYNLLACSCSRADYDPLWVELVSTKKFSHETVNFFKSAKFFDAYLESRISLMKSEKLVDRLNGIVYDKDGMQFGNLCAVSRGCPFLEEDYALMEIICDKLTLEIQKSGIDSGGFLMKEEAVLIDIIEGEKTLTVAQKSQIEDLAKRLKKNIYVAVVDICNYDHSYSHLVYFTEIFKNLRKDFHYFTYLNNIVILFSSEQVILNVEYEMKELNEFFKEYNFYAGISSGMKNLYDLNVHFKQALNALNYGIEINNTRNIFSRDIFQLELFLNEHLDDMNIEKMCHPLFFAIRDYDKQNKTNFLESLYTYFICGLNVDCAVKKLNKSREEFNAMLDNAGKLFDIDFTDGNMQFALFRSIKLYKCFFERFSS